MNIIFYVMLRSARRGGLLSPAVGKFRVEHVEYTFVFSKLKACKID